jgi:sugar O-acyltransferase (sialic acid O-acetyltransferase NeuD family)
MKKGVVIFGVKDTAELAWWYLKNDSNYHVVAFTVHRQYITEPYFHDLPVIPFEEITDFYPPEDFDMFAPLTGVKMNTLRKTVFESIKSLGYHCISYVSSRATVCGNIIGENCFILEDNTLQPFTKIGNNVVMWSGNHIGHHGVIEDHVFFTSHVVLSGHCHVKERAWLGVNATIRDYTTIGKGCLISMGALITKSTEDNSFYMGVPARKQEKNALDVY